VNAPVASRALRTLAEVRLREAEILLAAGEWSGAYYLSGYAVECGLKAIIARQFHADTIPDRDLIKRVFSHNLEELLGLAGFKAVLTKDSKIDSALGANWDVASLWNEQSRYEIIDEQRARALVKAVADVENGVLQWIRKLW
jgi:HEPN domain-containing protein